MNKGGIILIGLVVLFISIVFLVIPDNNSESQVPAFTVPTLFSEINDTDGIPETPSNAEGITVDSKGNLYIGLIVERVVVKITQSGEQSIFAEIPDEGALLGLATDGEDNIYVADFNFVDPTNSCDCIRRISADGEISIYASGIPTPNGLAFDKNGNLFITSSFQGAIYKIDESGNVELFIENDLIRSHDPNFGFGANGIAITNNGDIYVANTGDSSIIKISGDNLTIFGQKGEFPGADGLALDSAGNLYIAQNSANRISALTPNGETIVIAENDDSEGINGELESPASISFYKDKLYVTNADFPMVKNTENEKPFTISVLEIGIQGQ
jgi:sugar lactone lactonase YvrE